MTPMTLAEYLELLTVERFFTPPPTRDRTEITPTPTEREQRKTALYEDAHLRLVTDNTKETA